MRTSPAAVRISVALAFGIFCHTILANVKFFIYFQESHSLLLTPRGSAFLQKIAPFGHGQTLATTAYANIASFQLQALFALRTPSGIICWQAEGIIFGGIYSLMPFLDNAYVG